MPFAHTVLFFLDEGSPEYPPIHVKSSACNIIYETGTPHTESFSSSDDLVCYQLLEIYLTTFHPFENPRKAIEIRLGAFLIIGRGLDEESVKAFDLVYLKKIELEGSKEKRSRKSALQKKPVKKVQSLKKAKCNKNCRIITSLIEDLFLL